MRIGIIGSGALASYFAARLATVSEVVMVGSWRAQLAAVRNGLTLVHLDGQETVHRLAATTDPATVGAVDVALVLVKSYQTATAVGRVETILQPNGLAITLQNGLGNLEPLQAAVGTGRAALGIVTIGATLATPGRVRHAGAGTVTLAQSGHPLFVPLVSTMRRAGLDVRTEADVAGLVWGKLAVNTAINPLTALLRVTNGMLGESKPLRRIATAAAEEVAAVAAAQDIALPFVDAAVAALRVAQDTFHNRSSMLQDLENGRATEIDAICGAVVRAGMAYGVPAPVNRQLWQMVSTLEDGKAIADWHIRVDNEAIDIRVTND